MAERREEEFLDDIETAEAEELAVDFAEIDDAEAEIDALRAESDTHKEKNIRD